MDEPKRDVYLVPYIDGLHWQLMVIIPKACKIIWFCSLHRKMKNDLKTMLQGVIGKSRGQLVQILYPKVCNQQLDSWECGFYVMCWIQTIIRAVITDDWNERFKSTSPIPKDTIRQIRQEWTAYLLQRWRKDGKALEKGDRNSAEHHFGGPQRQSTLSHAWLPFSRALNAICFWIAPGRPFQHAERNCDETHHACLPSELTLSVTCDPHTVERHKWGVERNSCGLEPVFYYFDVLFKDLDVLRFISLDEVGSETHSLLP
ncbi:hypothetical protein LR48_Vigan115s000700 [Vigna angularis]|uniref:Ubiquitin-like protease family profile domain-containing protein n=1 Tax=Phaseolus angularis TaxID=3914 RepID=A0A0L9T4N4_PHAAN|nr:hypothetical protein LR48_Vigan115s000700 [Vigna angularis]